MSFRFCVLGSGSSGNSIAFWDSETTFLIDAGFSCREIGSRLGEIGKDSDEIKAVFVSHEHVDHARGTRVLNRRFGMDVLSTPTTCECLVDRYNVQAKPDIEPGRTFRLGGFSIKPFEVPHDASQTVGFIVKHGRKKVVVATDLGHMSSSIRNKFKNSNAIILESNHDIRMLKDGPYPAFLKKRILGKTGHLSNIESAATLASVISDRTKHIILAHLSQENNKPEIALEESKKLLSSISKKALAIVPASQFEISEVIKVNGE